MKIVQPAREVRIACFRKPPSVPIYFRIDKIGQYIPNVGKVVYCRPPPPVYITLTTEVEFVKLCDIEWRELKHNILVEVRYGKKFTKYLIYPKSVWEIVWNKYLEPMHRGDPPYEPGLLLYGPKGTGKTSTIEIVSDYLGLYRVDVDPSIMSKWIGETEQKFMELLAKAEANEPSIVNMDEMDTLVRKREGSMLTGDIAITLGNILAILLRRMPQYKKEGRRILIILATNISPSMIDDALLRHERFGSPVFVPLPDYEAVLTMMQLHKVNDIIGDRATEELAYQLTALGTSMADVVRVIEEIKEKKTIPDLSIISKLERGYKRPFPAKLPNVSLDKVLDLFRPYTSGRSRLQIYIGSTPYPAAEALLVIVLARLNVPAVVLTDYRKLDEAVQTAETCNSVLIVPADHMPKDVLSMLHLSAKCAVWYAASGRIFQDLPTVSLDSIKMKIGAKTLIELVCSYYGVEYSEEDIKKLMAVGEGKLAAVLRELAYRSEKKLTSIVNDLRRGILYS
ncbi:MAG: AAA family ATPase [Crenarchaeota archaeon]|nr:AAA family ATPase [Thermoproteota archaeon]